MAGGETTQGGFGVLYRGLEVSRFRYRRTGSAAAQRNNGGNAAAAGLQGGVISGYPARGGPVQLHSIAGIKEPGSQ